VCTQKPPPADELKKNKYHNGKRSTVFNNKEEKTMPPPLKIELSEAQRRELEEMRDHHELAYLRERAAAISKITAGHSGLETARNLLNRAHWQDTLYDWVNLTQLGHNALVVPALKWPAQVNAGQLAKHPGIDAFRVIMRKVHEIPFGRVV
jgi:hypothetical protein